MVVFGITTIRGEKQGVIKKSYLIAAALVLQLLKEMQAWLSVYLPDAVVVKRQGKMEMTNF